MNEQAKEVAKLIKNGKVTIFSGAGLSTESGLMDFRSKNGIWAHVDPTEMASVGVMERRYNEFLSFYKSALYVPETIKPNIGHTLIAEWEKKGLINGIITQNIDGLHYKAGSQNIAELHGSLEPITCCSCGKRGSERDFLDGVPCECGGHLRPNVVLFGEMLPEKPLQLADKWSNNCDTFIVLGSSLVVSPANYFPRQAKNHGAKLVIINRESTQCDSMADIVVHEGIGNFLKEVSTFI
ncbi:MAG: NAD-dependent deacylase [Synergistaceae bacterium]